MGVLNSRPWRRASTWNRGYRAPATAHEIDDVLVAADVIVYFGDAESKICQLDEWLPMLEELNRTTASRRPPPARHFVQIRPGALAQAHRPLRPHLGGRERLEQLHFDRSLRIAAVRQGCAGDAAGAARLQAPPAGPCGDAGRHPRDVRRCLTAHHVHSQRLSRLPLPSSGEADRPGRPPHRPSAAQR